MHPDLSQKENLSNYEEIEWYQFQQLTESISMQPNGAREAIEAIRKKLKHGTTHQKLRVLEVRVVESKSCITVIF